MSIDWKRVEELDRERFHSSSKPIGAWMEIVGWLIACLRESEAARDRLQAELDVYMIAERTATKVADARGRDLNIQLDIMETMKADNARLRGLIERAANALRGPVGDHMLRDTPWATATRALLAELEKGGGVA